MMLRHCLDHLIKSPLQRASLAVKYCRGDKMFDSTDSKF
jgi:hypothetical protein